jgi:hypothetical protein
MHPLHAGLKMKRTHLRSCSLYLALIAFLFLTHIDTAHARKCSVGCKKNRRGKYVCTDPGGRVLVCKKQPRALGFSNDGPVHDAAPAPDEDNWVPDYDDPAGYMYNDEDEKYEYEDGSVVPDLDSYSSSIFVDDYNTAPTPAPAPGPLPTPVAPFDLVPIYNSASRLAPCSGRLRPCRVGCFGGRCCANGQAYNCRPARSG